MAKNVKGTSIKTRLDLVGLEDREEPELRIQVRHASGKVEEIKRSSSGEFELSEGLIGKRAQITIGTPDGAGTRRFSYDNFVERVRTDGVYPLAEGIWQHWIRPLQCVSGRVEVCRGFWPPFQQAPFTTLANANAIGSLSLVSGNLADRFQKAALFPFRCEPVCDGRVEVYVRTCCCPPLTPVDPPVIIRDLCEIIDCDPPVLEWPPKPPFPPEPWPGPDPLAGLELATERALERAVSVEGAPSRQRVLWASRHLGSLMSLRSPDAQLEYIDVHPELIYPFCTCSTQKVAEVPLEPDGTFSACFPYWLLFPVGCYRTVQYKVIQFQEGAGDVVVYDGLARNERFGLSEDAVLKADWRAQSCDQTQYDDGAKPFVLLEMIGGTWADELIYSGKAAGIDPQDGETSFKPLAVSDGLVTSAERPWGKTLSLRFQFHPGLEGLGATKYRVRVVGVDDNGNHNGYESTLTGNVSWRKYFDNAGTTSTKWESLNLPGGFYQIPYPDNAWPWLGGQFHANVDTTMLTNGRYLFVVDIYDAAGNRLIPNLPTLTAGAGELKKNFEFLRLRGPVSGPVSDTIAVQHKALGNLFLADNLACQGEIHGIAHGASTSLADCQFLTGLPNDEVKIQYTARHDHGYQEYHWVRTKRGLFGGWQNFDLSPAAGDQTTLSSNVTAGFTEARTFGDLLTHDSPPETKCTFTVQLYVKSKHTNGSGPITEYDRWHTGSFAVEIEGA